MPDERTQEETGHRPAEARDNIETASRYLNKAEETSRDARRAVSQRQTGAALWQLGRIEKQIEQARAALALAVAQIETLADRAAREWEQELDRDRLETRWQDERETGKPF